MANIRFKYFRPDFPILSMINSTINLSIELDIYIQGRKRPYFFSETKKFKLINHPTIKVLKIKIELIDTSKKKKFNVKILLI